LPKRFLIVFFVFSRGNPGQEFIQNRGTIYPPFIQYITPSAPIETDEVTLYSVLIVGL